MPDVTRLVVDTNIVVAAALSDRAGRESPNLELLLWILEDATDSPQMLTSNEILAEYERTLRRVKFRLSPEYVDVLLLGIELVAIPTRPRRRVSLIRDPSDNPFMDCALENEADYLITNNMDDYPREHGIISADEFLDLEFEEDEDGEEK